MLKKNNPHKATADGIDPFHFKVFKLKADCEKKAFKYCSEETIDAFNKRQELLKTIPRLFYY